ncbi:MAG TPA: alpha-E domain-containing protein [Isosphaeraceae bacterium]|jgi:uncharacterized alpha-E superfamily protein
MLSRVAENLYWISRYVERAENVARLLDVGFFIELDAPGLTAGGPEGGAVEGVLTILACRSAFQRVHPGGGRDAVLHFLTFDRQHRQSILAMIARARENARGTQEALSAEAWRQINTMYLYLESRRALRRFRASPSRFFDGIKRGCILFAGLIDGTLPRSEAFHFLQLGRYLERVGQVSRILNVRLHDLRDPDAPTAEPAVRTIQWSSLLRSCSAYEAFLRQHHERIDPPGIVRYLVLDADFPRAMRFCVARCLESLRAIAADSGFGAEAERLLGRLDSELRYLDVGEILGQGLSPFLSGIQDACNRIGDEIHRAYFFS